MHIFVNNESISTEHPSNLQQLLSKLELADAKGMAVAINNRVINRSLWHAESLVENDKITIIKASAGG